MLRPLSRAVGVCLMVCFAVMSLRPASAADPFFISNAPKVTPTIDGDVSDWADIGSDKLRMSWAHNERGGNPSSEPLVVDISYAWDDTNFYTLVEEVTVDDDPSEGFTDVEWCKECNGDDKGDVAPWSTDSIGFYDKGIRWPNNETEGILEVGPFSQWWVGLTTEDELVIGEDTQYRHLARTISTAGGEGGGRLVGPASEEHETFDHRFTSLPELTEPQSAFSVIDGKRVVEFFMRWDQIRYDSEDPAVTERIVELLPAIEGHLLQDVGEGYEFRLDPLLVDGAEDFSFGSQTHPSGIEHPDHADEFSDIAVVRLTGAPEGTGDVAGDSNGDGIVDATDLNVVGLNWQMEVSNGAEDGDFNGDGIVNAADLNVLGNNWQFGAGAAPLNAAVPEPTGLLLGLCGLLGLLGLRRSK